MDVGAHLRRAREAQGISLALLAARTRVQPRILNAIELNDVQGIPPKPFGRGFVRAYAHEVGLDPEHIVHDYFGQFAPAIPPADEHQAARDRRSLELPQWIVPAVLAAVIAVGAIVFLRNNGRGTTEAAAPDAVGTTGSAPPATAAAPLVARAPATSNPITLVVRAERACWITASADGVRVLYQILPAGSSRTLEAAREIMLRAGDAGALHLTLNGRSVGAFGGSGEVRQARVTVANLDTFGAPARR